MRNHHLAGEFVLYLDRSKISILLHAAARIISPSAAICFNFWSYFAGAVINAIVRSPSITSIRSPVATFARHCDNDWLSCVIVTIMRGIYRQTHSYVTPRSF